ncbi:hypothetical protein BpHYR1_023778 [Brachionus plicatilis]|uniref:Uncharacterized protein n=1 Tax=Brachionus plicatilis TaxID=10195 RepID=A0A3M7QEN6_BRAPC|nr:hypothetical protein BpHYR1_023778 [Brachionus plicatilis]
MPQMYNQNQSVVYAPIDSGSRAPNELYLEPASQVTNIKIKPKINVNFQMADAYSQQNTASNYPAYDQPVFSDQSVLSSYQQNQYLRQSYETMCVNRTQSKQANISYGSVFAKNEPNFKVHSSNDLSSINTDMCDLKNNFEEEVYNENMYFLKIF